jgi:hypothetical protein
MSDVQTTAEKKPAYSDDDARAEQVKYESTQDHDLVLGLT